MILREPSPPTCPDCGSTMIALFSTYGCPQGCDRIARGRCPACDSPDVEPYEHPWLARAMHCKPCGRVWQRRTT